MNRSKLFTAGVIVALMLALPLTALASKRVYKAQINAANEVADPPVQSPARGSLVLSSNPDGSYHFLLNIRDLTSPVTNIHLHAPAPAGMNTGVEVTLCGVPAPGAIAVCGGGTTFSLSGDIPGALLRNMTGGEFQDALEAGLVYVNVHTQTYPAGEARGQLIRANP